MKKGFTLIEMLIVMAVVSILIAIIIPSYRGMQNDAWLAKAAKETQSIQVAVESYYRHHNDYPDNLGELLTTTPLILNKLPDDPWRTEDVTQDYITYRTYGYKKSNLRGFGEYYIIYSKGVDGNDDVAITAPANGRLELPAASDDIVQSNLPVFKNK